MKRLTDLPERDLERLSAYLDGELAGRDLERLESRLQADPDLRAALDELRVVTRLMAALPARRAPRNFTLRPEMVRQRAASRAYPRLQLATALATIAFAVTFGLEFLAGSVPMARGAAFQSEAALAPRAAEEFAAAPAEEAAPSAADALIVTTPTGPADQTALLAAGGEEATAEVRIEAATEAPLAEAPVVGEALPGSVQPEEGAAQADAGEAEATPCGPCAAKMATAAPAIEATEPPMLALLAPEAEVPSPASESTLGAADTPVVTELAAAAPSLSAATQTPPPTLSPTASEPPSAAEPSSNAAAVSGEDQASRALAETPADSETAEPAVPPAPGRAGWTPLRALQVGLACVTLVLASLTVWARQQR
jgi:anti-sigma factor RsiW